jgi:DNA-binding response OmpR family regulator
MPQIPRNGRLPASALLVSADRTWLASTTAFLAASTTAVRTAENSAEAVEALVRDLPDVTVVAPPLSSGSALTLIGHVGILREARRLGIIYVAERERELADHVRLLRAGANDWFPRGLPASEAASRITALLNALHEGPTDPYIRRGPLVLTPLTRTAAVGDVDLALSDREFSILAVLAHAVGRAMTASELAKAVGARRTPHTTRDMDATIRRLHAKLGAARGLLDSSPRYGYRIRFVAPL